MSTDIDTPAETGSETGSETEGPVAVGPGPDDAVEVRRDGPLSAVVAVVAGVVSVAYLARAAGAGGLVDWALGAVVGLVALMHLAAVLDARAPLMVLDRHGVRVRRGRTWQGVAWPEVDRVDHQPRESVLRDGRLSVVDLDGRELAVRLSLSTRLIGANWHELTEALVDLTEDRVEVQEVARTSAAPAVDQPLETEPAPEAENETETAAEPEPELEQGIAEPLVPTPTSTPTLTVTPSPTPEPAREAVRGARAEITFAPSIALDDTGWSDEQPTIAARPDRQITEAIVIGDVGFEPVPDPVVGPVLAGARVRLGLSVDQLADRTRIRPHVIESIEVDDFAPCGGDFYARGHLRTLARILGVEATPLLAAYDERYAAAPIDPRRVFEAELTTGVGGTMRGTRGGMNWSVLIAAVMAVVLVWSIARLVTDGPVPLSDRPILNGSPGGKAAMTGATTKVSVELVAPGGGAEVIVRNGSGEVVFKDQLAFMQTARLDVAPPIRVQSSDGSVTFAMGDDDAAALGETGQPAQKTFVP